MARKFTLCLLGLLFLVSCGHGPKLTVCISDPANSGFQCVRPDQSSFVLPYNDSENYVALSPSDAEALFNYLKSCRQGGHK